MVSADAKAGEEKKGEPAMYCTAAVMGMYIAQSGPVEVGLAPLSTAVWNSAGSPTWNPANGPLVCSLRNTVPRKSTETACPYATDAVAAMGTKTRRFMT